MSLIRTGRLFHKPSYTGNYFSDMVKKLSIMENMLFVVIMIFVGMVVGARFIVGILRIFPFFTLLSFGGQSSSNNNNNNSDGGGGAIGWTMIFVFLLSFFLMFVYYEGKMVDVEESVSDRLETIPEIEKRKDFHIPKSLDRINPRTENKDGLISVGHNIPQVDRTVEVDEFKNDISSIDRSALIEDPSIRSLDDLEIEMREVFYFQVTASSKKAFALAKVNELKDKTDKDVFLGVLKEYGPVPYKVLIGPFYERSAAKKFGRRNNLKGFVREADHLQLYRR